MKLADRIRPIADTPEYAEFRKWWQKFIDAGETGYPGHVSLMIQYGNGLHRQVMTAAADHAKAQVRSPYSLTEPTADQLLAEARYGAERCMRKLMPELHAYAEFIDRALTKTTRPLEAVQ